MTNLQERYTSALKMPSTYRLPITFKYEYIILYNNQSKYILVPTFYGLISQFRLVTVGEFAVQRPTERFSRIDA